MTPYHRLGLWLTRSVPGVYVFRYVLTPMDILVLRLTQCRLSLAPQGRPRDVAHDNRPEDAVASFHAGALPSRWRPLPATPV